MLGKDLIFILLLGFALGVGKVVSRLDSHDLALFLAIITVSAPLAILVYSVAYGMPIFLALTWFAICLFVGAVSGYYSHAQ